MRSLREDQRASVSWIGIYFLPDSPQRDPHQDMRRPLLHLFWLLTKQKVCTPRVETSCSRWKRNQGAYTVEGEGHFHARRVRIMYIWIADREMTGGIESDCCMECSTGGGSSYPGSDLRRPGHLKAELERDPCMRTSRLSAGAMAGERHQSTVPVWVGLRTRHSEKSGPVLDGREGQERD